MLVRCTVPMQGLGYGEVVTVDEKDPHIAGLVRAGALVPVEPVKRAKRNRVRSGT